MLASSIARPANASLAVGATATATFAYSTVSIVARVLLHPPPVSTIGLSDRASDARSVARTCAATSPESVVASSSSAGRDASPAGPPQPAATIRQAATVNGASHVNGFSLHLHHGLSFDSA